MVGEEKDWSTGVREGLDWPLYLGYISPGLGAGGGVGGPGGPGVGGVGGPGGPVGAQAQAVAGAGQGVGLGREGGGFLNN